MAHTSFRDIPLLSKITSCCPSQLSQFTAAVVGAGMGGKGSMAALSASQRFRLVAVADLQAAARAAAQEMYPGIRTYASHAEMFADCPTDVVCVSTWPPSHLEVTRAALRLPLRGILVEKPLADSFADGRQLLELVRAKNLPMAVPHGLLVADHSRQILERVHNGEIGQLKLVEIQSSSWDIINAGIHWLNFYRAAAGILSTLVSIGSTFLWR